MPAFARYHPDPTGLANARPFEARKLSRSAPELNRLARQSLDHERFGARVGRALKAVDRDHSAVFAIAGADIVGRHCAYPNLVFFGLGWFAASGCQFS